MGSNSRTKTSIGSLSNQKRKAVLIELYTLANIEPYKKYKAYKALKSFSCMSYMPYMVNQVLAAVGICKHRRHLKGLLKIST